ncbi:unnamed protein product [Prunus armeniaca]
MPANPKTRATSHWGPGYILTIPHTIISPLIRRDAPGHVWGLSTRRLIQRRVQPHTGGLATFSPSLTKSYLPSYIGTHPATYGVCQHAG